jgi:hypothetical protein
MTEYADKVLVEYLNAGLVINRARRVPHERNASNVIGR